MAAGHPTLAMARFERLLLVVQPDCPASEADWQRQLDLCREQPGPLRVLVETHGGGPNAKQRKALRDTLEGLDVRSAVLTNSFALRGVVTALSWLGITLRAFPLNDIREAASFLELTDDELSLAQDTLPRLRAECGIGKSG